MRLVKGRKSGLVTALGLAVGLLVGFALGMGPRSSTEAPEKVRSLPIVDKAIDFHGGDLYQRSTTTLRQCSKSGCFDLEVARRGGEYSYRVTRERNGATVEVLVTNDSAERRTDGALQPPDKEQVVQLRDFANARTYFPFLPYGLNDPSVWKEDLGSETWDGKALHKVRVTFTEGSSTDASDIYLYWFEPETGRLVQFAYSFGEGQSAGIRLRRIFNERRVGGILFADSRNYGAGGASLRVEDISPELLADGVLELISEVTLTDIEVEVHPEP